MVAESRLLSIAYGLLVTATVSWLLSGGDKALAVMTLSFACAVCAGVLHARAEKNETSTNIETWPLILLVLLANVLGWHTAFLGNGEILGAQHLLLLRRVLFGLIVLAYMTPLRRSAGIRTTVFATILTLSFVQLFMTPTVSPAPIIDVHGMSQWASGTLLSGHDPYHETMPNLYGPDYEAIFGVVDHYVYPPATLYLQTIWYALLGDVRYASAASILIFCLCLWLLSKDWHNDGKRELLILAFLANPFSIFIVEQSWTEPLLLALLGIGTVLRARGTSNLALVVFGYAFSLKQYLAFSLPALWLQDRRKKTVLIVGAAGLLTILPFLLWHPQAVIDNGILFQMKSGPIRYDSFNFAPKLVGLIGESTKQLTAIIGLLAAASTAWLFRRKALSGFLYSMMLITFSAFLFGGVAFVNYYYGVGGLILLTLAGSGKPARTAL